MTASTVCIGTDGCAAARSEMPHARSIILQNANSQIHAEMAVAHMGGIRPASAGVQSNFYRSCISTEQMALDYFYGQRAEQYAFYRIPKVLFSDKRFDSLSVEAKLLYGILLDRLGLSIKNGWLDNEGRVFIIFTIEEIMDALKCADQKATRLLRELEEKGGLIERKRRGLGRPNLIYLKDFMSNV